MGTRRRDSSADTSRDIEDIEDLELDMEEEQEEEEKAASDICDNEADGEDEDERLELTDRRLTGTMTSPDLAYCSMEGRLLTPDLT